MKVHLTPAAEAEVRDIYVWYEAQGEGLATEFKRALDACLGRIGRNPRAHAEVHGHGSSCLAPPVSLLRLLRDTRTGSRRSRCLPRAPRSDGMAAATRRITTRSTRRSSRHGACRASAAPLGPRVTAGVVQTTRTGLFSKHNHGSEHRLSGRLRSGAGSGRLGTASQSLANIHVLRWSEIGPGVLRGPGPFRGIAGVAGPTGQAFQRIAMPWRAPVAGSRSGAVARQSLLRRWLPRKRRRLPAVVNRRAVTEGGVAARGVEVKGLLSNNPFNPTRFAASRRLLAQAARRDSRAG